MTRMVGYTRVSTDRQREEGISLADQRDKLVAYAGVMGWDLVDVVEDGGYSGGSMERPGLRMVLQMLRCGEADGVLVLRLDRLTRSVRDLSVLIEDYFKEKYRLAAVFDQLDTSTATGRLVINILASVAQWTRETTAERTRETLAYLRGQGVALGAPPLGKTYGPVDNSGRKTVMVDEVDAPAIERIVALHEGGNSVRGIVEFLKHEGFRKRPRRRPDGAMSSTIWRRSHVQRVLEKLKEVRDGQRWTLNERQERR